MGHAQLSLPYAHARGVNSAYVRRRGRTAGRRAGQSFFAVVVLVSGTVVNLWGLMPALSPTLKLPHTRRLVFSHVFSRKVKGKHGWELAKTLYEASVHVIVTSTPLPDCYI